MTNPLREHLQRLRDLLVTMDPHMANDETLFLDTIDGETDALDQLRRILRRAIEDEVSVEAISGYKKILGQRQQRLQARADACRATVRDAMETLQIKQLPAPDFTAVLQRSPVGVRITDESALPPSFLRLVQSPNITAIGAALKQGADVPGAALSNQSMTLAIKRT